MTLLTNADNKSTVKVARQAIFQEISKSILRRYAPRVPGGTIDKMWAANRPLRAFMEENKFLLLTGGPFTAALGQRGLITRDALIACNSKRPCRQIGCPRCAAKRAAKSIAHHAAVIVKQTRARRSRAFVVVLNAPDWHTTPVQMQEVIEQRMRPVLNILRSVPGFVGLTGAVDANISELNDPDTADRLRSLPSDGAKARLLAATTWNVHLHITLLAGYDETASSLKEKIDEIFFEAGLLVDVKLKPLVKRHEYEKKRKNFSLALVEEDCYPTLIYGQKLNFGANMRIDELRMLQRALCGVQTNFNAGIFAANADTADKQVEDVLAADQYQMLLHAGQGLADLLVRYAPEAITEIKADIDKMNEAAGRLRVANRKISHINSCRAYRRRQAVTELRYRYQDALLARKIEQYEVKSAREMNKGAAAGVMERHQAEAKLAAAGLRKLVMKFFLYASRFLRGQPQLAEAFLQFGQLTVDEASDLETIASMKFSSPSRWFTNRQTHTRAIRLTLSLAAAKSIIDRWRFEYTQDRNLKAFDHLKEWERVYPAWHATEMIDSPRWLDHNQRWEETFLTLLFSD